jgi:hypothetical protein
VATLRTPISHTAGAANIGSQFMINNKHSSKDVSCKTDEKDGSNRGRHQSAGFPGKLTAARNHAPKGATTRAIRDVAAEAHKRGVKAQRVWAERDNWRISDYAGGESDA